MCEGVLNVYIEQVFLCSIYKCISITFNILSPSQYDTRCANGTRLPGFDIGRSVGSMFAWIEKNVNL